MKIAKLFKKGKAKRERVRALYTKTKPKKEFRWQNPYFPNKEKQEKQDFNFKYWFLKKDGWTYIGILILLLSSGFYLVFGAKYFIVKDISIIGIKNIKEQEVRQQIDQYLENKRLFIFPQNNWIFFSDEKVKQNIQNSVNNKFALENIEVTKKWPNKVEINITERIPGLTWVSNEQKYYVDLKGIVSQKINNEEEGGNKDLPTVFDENNTTVELNEQVISEGLVNFIISLEKNLSKVNLQPKNYFVPEVKCQEQQYKAEKIIKQEIEETENEEIKDKKRDILEQYNKGEISIDESLEMLETVKKEEYSTINGNSNVNNDLEEIIQWESVFVPKECNFVSINKEVEVEVADGFKVYFDSTLDLDKQLNILKNFLNQKVDIKNDLQYIDLRFTDRIYYK